MSIRTWNIILPLLLLVFLGAGAFILYSNHQEQLAKIAAEELRIEEERREKARALAQNFEDSLNGFLQALSAEISLYRKDRKVLMGLIKPVNLRDPTFVDENTALASETAKRLNERMERVVEMFSETDRELRALIPDLQKFQAVSAQEHWNAVKKTELERYLAFFESEQSIIDEVLTLMTFYNENQSDMAVDVIRDRVAFSNIETQARAYEIQEKLRRLKDEQAALFEDAE